jgi:hypothetical protein
VKVGPGRTRQSIETELVDQAALFGLLARLRDLGATLLLVERLPVGTRLVS